MSNSQHMTKRSMSIWQFILLIAMMYLLSLLISHQTTVFEKIYWSGVQLERLNEQGEWVSGNRWQIGSHGDIQEVRFTVSIDESEKWLRPVGLMVGGPFSAEIFWDEQKIADKGIVGNSKAEETPGAIDSIAFIPPELIYPGMHQIRMRISTQHLLAGDKSVFHYIWLAPYRESGRRDLRYYSVPLIVLSALLVLSFQSVRIGRNAGNPMHIGLGWFGFSIVILLITEISRALVNYPYPYHELRGIFGWFSNLGAGLALIYTCFRMIHERFSHVILASGLAFFFASYFIPMNSGDERLALDFLMLTFAPSAVFVVLLFKKHISYLSTLPLFWIACVVSNILSTGLFLDSFQFISALVLIAGAWLWVYVDFNKGNKPQPIVTGTETFAVSASGENKVIAVSDCYALKGEGNYTNLMLLDGKSILHQDGIGAIMNTDPVNFIRVHKSYAVNLNRVKKLKSAEGSKYWVEMCNGKTIPVSRYRVAEIRGLIESK